MKSTLLFILRLASCSSALTVPDGYLLVFKAGPEYYHYYNHLSLFQVTFTPWHCAVTHALRKPLNHNNPHSFQFSEVAAYEYHISLPRDQTNYWCLFSQAFKLKMKSTQLSILCLAVLVSYCTPLTIPNGYLLVLKASGYNYNKLSLFQVTFNGTVQQLWNHILNNTFYSPNVFDVDAKNQLVYIGTQRNQVLALSLTTGKVIVNKTLNASYPANFFVSYDYIPEENAIYGICRRNDDQFDWCRVKLGVPELEMESLYHLPGPGDSYTPVVTPCSMDKIHQTIWYYYDSIGYDVYGLHYTTREEIFHGKLSTTPPLTDVCTVHDYMLNRTFAIAFGPDGPVGPSNIALSELHPLPQDATKLLDLPSGIRLAYYGTCDYDQETHTMIALIKNDSIDFTPSQLLLIDVISLSYKSVALPEFRKWKDIFPAIGVKYIKN